VVDLVQQTLVLVQGVSQTQDVYQTHVVAVPLCQSPQALAQTVVGYFAQVACMGVVGYPHAQRQMPHRPHAFIPYAYFLDT